MFITANINCMRLFAVMVSCLVLSGVNAETDNKHHVDAYNHLTISFSMLREGIGAKAIRRDILDNLEQSKLTPQTKSIYKSLLELCDQIIANKERFKLKADAAKQAAIKENKDKLTRSVVKAGVAAVVSGGTSLPASLLGLLTSGGSSENYSVDKEKLSADGVIRKKLTDIEFKLSSFKSDIKDKHKVGNDKFIRTSDLAEYIKIKSSTASAQAKKASLVKLYLSSPAFYMGSHDLALYEFQDKSFDGARKYALAAVNNSPSIISRLPIRGKSNSLIGSILLSKHKDKKQAEKFFKAALRDVPGDFFSLVGLGYIATEDKLFDEAKVYFERVISLYPNSPTANYAYASYLALSGANENTVLKQVNKTISSGYNTAMLRKDKNLSPYLKKLKSGKKLKIKVSYGYKWRMLAPDIISIVNESGFALTNVSIDVIYREHKRGKVSGWFRHPKASVRTGKFGNLEVIKIESFDTTKKRLYDVKVEVKSDQGKYRFKLMNRNGQLVSY